MSLSRRLEQRLQQTASRGLLRRLETPRGVDFASNDYLGMSKHPRVRQHIIESLQIGVAHGAPASRLLRGHTHAHAALEARLERFKDAEAALLFSSGYMANMAVLTTLVESSDRVISDALNHASIIDAMRLSRCHKIIIPHLDVSALRALLETPHDGHTFIVTESLFSMDGDIAPLSQYADLAERYDASLIIDDSHGIGVFGSKRASGLTEGSSLSRRAVATVSTFGKALGVGGACVTATRLVVDSLVNHARPFIFSTALPPLLVHAIDAALDVLEAEPRLGERARLRAAHLRECLDLPRLDNVGPIVPLIIGDNDRAMRVAATVRAAGYDVRAVRPPTVAPGTARLRLSVHADHTDDDIRGVAAAIRAALG